MPSNRCQLRQQQQRRRQPQRQQQQQRQCRQQQQQRQQEQRDQFIVALCSGTVHRVAWSGDSLSPCRPRQTPRSQSAGKRVEWRGRSSENAPRQVSVSGMDEGDGAAAAAAAAAAATVAQRCGGRESSLNETPSRSQAAQRQMQAISASKPTKTQTARTATATATTTTTATATPAPAPTATGWLFRCRQAIVFAAASALLLLALTAGAQETGEPSATTATPFDATGAPEQYQGLSLNGSLSGSSHGAHKLKPVNFTLVDELFEAALSDDDVVRRWRQMDNQFQDGIKSILKLVFPQIVAISQDAKVSGECSGGILKWILSLRNLRSWAIKMLDATGKPTAGIFEGSLSMLGNYRQCLNIRAPDEDEIEITDQFEEYFRGQFCVLHLKPWLPAKRHYYHMNTSIEALLRRNYKYYEKTLYDELAEIAIAFQFIDIRADLCVPSTCTLADIQRVADLLSRKLEMRAKVMRCDTQPRDAPIAHLIDRQTALWLLFPALVAVIVALGSLLSALWPQSPRRPALGADSHWLLDLSRCVSVQSSLRSRLGVPARTTADSAHCHRQDCRCRQDCDCDCDCNCSADDGKRKLAVRSHRAQRDGGGNDDHDHNDNDNDNNNSLTTLDGERKPAQLYALRSVFVFWFIIIQMTVELKYQYLRESLTLRNMMLNYWPLQIIINSTLVFESIICVTAFTFAYTNIESTFDRLVGYIVRKYARLTPSIATVIALTISIPIIGIESPVWRNFVDQQAQVCKSTGFLDLLYLQNFISYDKICLPHTWLFCVEMQLMILSVPLVVLLRQAFLSCENSLILQEQSGGAAAAADDDDAARRSHFWRTLTRTLASSAGLLCSALIALGCAANFYSVYAQRLPPSWFYTFPDGAHKSAYFGQHLAKPWTHLTGFVVGLFAGHLCRSTARLNETRLLKRASRAPARAPCCACSVDMSASTRSSPLSTPTAARASAATVSTATGTGTGTGASHSGSVSAATGGRRSGPRREPATAADWRRTCVLAAALAAMCAIIFSSYNWSVAQELPSALVASLYDALSRLVWCIALAAIAIQLCSHDAPNGQSDGSALSHPMFVLCGRLSFLAYLLTPLVHTLVLAVGEQLMFPSLIFVFHLIVGNFVIIYSLTLILAIVIEQPIGQLISRLVLNGAARTRRARRHAS